MKRALFKPEFMPPCFKASISAFRGYFRLGDFISGLRLFSLLFAFATLAYTQCFAAYIPRFCWFRSLGVYIMMAAMIPFSLVSFDFADVDWLQFSLAH